MSLEEAKTLTRVVSLILLALALVYDVAIAVKFGREATISAVLYDAAKDNPIVGVIAGVLMGHWFFPIRS